MPKQERFRKFTREKKIYCGKNYMEVDIIPCTEKRKGKRTKRGKSRKQQVNLNDKNSRRYFAQLGKANFSAGDTVIHCTYEDKFYPKTIEDGIKQAKNYLRRIEYHMKKQGLELKYMLVTEFTPDEENEDKPVRLHHHIIINRGLDRNFVEDLWGKEVWKKKGKKKVKERIPFGFVNADRLQENENGIDGMTNYMQKRKEGCKRWSTSQNLKKPTVKQNDSKYSRKKVNDLRKTPEDKEHWRNEFPGFEPSEIKWEYNEFNGWSVYVKLRRIDKIMEDEDVPKKKSTKKKRKKSG